MSNHMLFLVALACLVMGWWKIPSVKSELSNPLAPYRALTGALQVIIGLVFWVLWFLTTRGKL